MGIPNSLSAALKKRIGTSHDESVPVLICSARQFFYFTEYTSSPLEIPSKVSYFDL